MISIPWKCNDGEEYLRLPMQREKMAGGNLREGLREVAPEQGTERNPFRIFSRVSRIPDVTRERPYWRPAECMDYSMNLGGNTDENSP